MLSGHMAFYMCHNERKCIVIVFLKRIDEFGKIRRGSCIVIETKK